MKGPRLEVLLAWARWCCTYLYTKGFLRTSGCKSARPVTGAGRAHELFAPPPFAPRPTTAEMAGRVLREWGIATLVPGEQPV